MNIDQHYRELRRVAINHRLLTGTTLAGLTGEVGEWITAKICGLKLVTKANNPGYDATRSKTKIQIKSAILSPVFGLTQVCYSHVSTSHKWNIILFLIMDIQYMPICIYSMTKADLRKAQTTSGKKYKSITYNQIKKNGKLIYTDDLFKYGIE